MSAVIVSRRAEAARTADVREDGAFRRWPGRMLRAFAGVCRFAAPVAMLWLAAPSPALAGDIDSSQPQAGVYVPRSREQLEATLAPIALYPDVLLAQMLPASTFPTQIVMASRYVEKTKDTAGLADQHWDISVQTVARYPQVLAMMNDKLDWTVELGAVYVGQTQEVMATIQTLRARAEAAGNLADNDKQKVVVQQSTIKIIPANPQVVYVPQYDPLVVYVQPAPSSDTMVTASVVSFGLGMAVGSWLDADCDWTGYRVYYPPYVPYYPPPGYYPRPVGYRPYPVAYGTAVVGPYGGAAAVGPYGGAAAVGPYGGAAVRAPNGAAAAVGPNGGTAVRHADGSGSANTARGGSAAVNSQGQGVAVGANGGVAAKNGQGSGVVVTKQGAAIKTENGGVKTWQPGQASSTPPSPAHGNTAPSSAPHRVAGEGGESRPASGERGAWERPQGAARAGEGGILGALGGDRPVGGLRERFEGGGERLGGGEGLGRGGEGLGLGEHGGGRRR